MKDMNLDRLNLLNSHIYISNISDAAFRAYGKIITAYDFSEIIEYMENSTIIPKEGNIYVPSVPEMESTPVFSRIQEDFFGDMPIQIGYCNGSNSNLNGLEYHKGTEINVAVTDLILLLGKVQDICSNNYDSKLVEAFYLPKGTAIELYGTTLHFAPCKTFAEGFKCIVILPRHTNLPLEHKPAAEGEARLLFMKNKWLLAHPDRKVLIDKGAYPGIIGSNIEIRIDDK